MATQDDVRRIALSLAGAYETPGRFAFNVPTPKGDKGFVWVWMERVHPKKARVPQPKVLAVRTASLADKDTLLASDQTKFFTEPHYNGYPAVMVRLDEVNVRELRALIVSAYSFLVPTSTSGGTAPGTARAPRRAPSGRRRP